MRRAALVLVLPLVLACQPPHTARVVRSGNSVHVGFRLGSACDVPLAGQRLLFDRTISADPYDLKITFTYDAPRQLPADWPAGNWCESLLQRVRSVASSQAARVRNQVFDDPRAASAAIASALQRDLGISTSSISARFDLPAGWKRAQSVADVARLARPAPPVIFIGLDGADWQLLDDSMARGTMPNLARMVREGTSGVVTTEHPPLSPILWTTMMTGASPLDHQILDFTRFNPASGATEPITSDERRVPAVWNMATMAGKSVDTFGLWATYPAEPVHGIMVSDRLFTFLFAEASPPPGIVFPPTRDAWARNVAAAAQQSVSPELLKTFLPWMSEQQYDDIVSEQNPYAKPGSALRRILIDTEIYRRLAEGALAQSVPDLTIVYFEGTDTIGHTFAPYAPPKQPEVTQEDYDRYNQVPELYFRRVDAILGEFLTIAERNHGRVMIASDHGFQWKEGRPTTISSFATATAAKWHRKEGIFLAWGNGIPATPGHTVRGTIRQVCATLLALTDLPRGERVTGPPLIASPNPAAVDYRKFFEPFTPPAVANAGGSNEELAKLRALGYIGTGESTGSRPAAAGQSTKTAGAYNNEGLILKNDGRIPEAIAAFEQAMKIDPNLGSAEWNLSDLLFEHQQDLARSDKLLVEALAHGLPDAPKYVIERAIWYQKSGHPEHSLDLLESAVAAKPDSAELHMFRGRYRVDQKNCAGALEDFRAAAQLRPDDPVAFTSAGLAEICLGDRAAAEADFRHSLQLDPNQPMLRRFLKSE